MQTNNLASQVGRHPVTADLRPMASRSYRITGEPHPNAQDIGGLWLSCSEDLNVLPVRDHTGGTAGVFVGAPIDLNRALFVKEQWTLPSDVDLVTESGLLRILQTLGGSFIWICVTERYARIFPDAGTQIPCVWDQSGQGAGSTAAQILSEADYLRRFDHQEFEQLATSYNGFFPAGLTAHAGVRRLLPNHYLDLETWTAHRISAGTQTDTFPSADACVDTIVDQIQRQITAHVSCGQGITLGLTAGYSSRAVLATARPWSDDLTCLTFSGARTDRRDEHLADAIGSGLALSHRRLPIVTAFDGAKTAYLRRAGHCVGDQRLHHHTSFHPINKDNTLISGVGGALAGPRPLYDADDQNALQDPVHLLATLGIRGTDKSIRQLRLWREGLTGAEAPEHFDSLYLECGLGPRLSAHFTADPLHHHLAPFLTYSVVASMRQLPLEWRRTNRLFREVNDRLWPALNGFPYNLGTFAISSAYPAQRRA